MQASKEQFQRLRSFLAPQVLNLILNSSDEELLTFRQRDITVAFCDLRGFTAFAHTAPAGVIMDVLSAYHQCIGPVIVDVDGILERFTGDGVMVYFDQTSLEEQALRAVHMATRIRHLVGRLSEGWRRRGHQLSLGVGIALGEATLGPIGFDQRRDYAAIGPVTNLASRLCAEAGAGEVLVTDRLYASAGHLIQADSLGRRRLKGFDEPVEVYRVHGVSAPGALESAGVKD
jgi:class 3 adenylate cyclase